MRDLRITVKGEVELEFAFEIGDGELEENWAVRAEELFQAYVHDELPLDAYLLSAHTNNPQAQIDSDILRSDGCGGHDADDF